MRVFQKFLIAFGAICIAGLATFSAHAYSSSFHPNVSLEKTENIKLQDKIIIDFSFPVLTSIIEKNLTVSPDISVNYVWENGNRRLVIIPKNHWETDTDYNVSILGGRNIFYSSFDAKLSFSTEKKPAIESITPISGEKNVAVDIQDPIKVVFDRPLSDYAVKFMVTPEQKLTYEMSGDKKSIRLLASDDFKFSTNYNIQVFTKLKIDDQNAFQKVGETSFTTVAPPPPPIVDWAKSFNDRAVQAKQFTQAQITTGKYIDINLKQQVMVLFEDGQPLDSYVISSGKASMPTPVGKFKIENKTPRAWSKEFGLWMPWWEALVPSGSFGIHELPEWPSGYKEGAAHLGTPVSHGCVRLGVGPAKRVYDWTDIGTPVITHF